MELRHLASAVGLGAGARGAVILLALPAALLPSPAAATDPLSGPPWSAHGGQTLVHFGAAAHTAGDVNGDTYSDFLVGAPDTPGGRAYLYLGTSDGLSPAAAWSPVGGDPQSRFGAAVACAGDVNGDGFADVVVGDPAAHASPAPANTTNSGIVYLYLGSISGLPGTPSQTIYGGAVLPAASPGDGFGEVVAPAGDFNNDGYDDVLVAAPRNDELGVESGRFALLLGGPGGLTVDAVGGFGTPQSRMGRGLAAAGDLNGDGFDDIAVGLPGRAEVGLADAFQGRVLVYYGKVGGLVGATQTQILAPDGFVDDAFGFSVSTAGDVNGDQYTDLLIGAPKRAYFENARAGAAFLFLGGPGGVATAPVWSYTGPNPFQETGTSVATAGDFDGDGRGDVVVGEPGLFANSGRAAVFVYSDGGESGYLDFFTSLNGSAGERAGAVVGTAGDVNGDGFSDVFSTAPSASGGPAEEGAARVYLGHGRNLGSAAARTAWGGSSGARLGRTVAGSGDVNGDGFSDYLVCQPFRSDGFTEVGGVELYFGGPDGPSTSPGWTLDATSVPEAGQRVGTGGAIVGDVNGDGYDDVAVGATGFAMVFHGNATGNLPSAYDWAAWPAGQVSTGLTQVSLSSAGDVNADGYGDVLVGVSDFPVGAGPDSGYAALYLGSPSGLGAPVRTWRATQGGEQLGSSVAYAGDVNGDGYGDVLIGASGWDNVITFHGIPIETITDTGRIQLFLGEAGGVGAAPYRSWVGDDYFTYMGTSCSTAGDLNADGFDDILVSEPGYANEGRIRIYLGSASGPVAFPSDFAFGIGAPTSWFGGALASAGDVDNDGYADIAIGAQGFDYVSGDEGLVVLYRGHPSGLDPGPPAYRIGTAAGDALGWSVAPAGDVNGDGFSDLIVGAPYAENGLFDQGASYLLPGGGHFGKHRRVRQLTAASGDPVAVRGGAPTYNFWIEVWGHTAAGRVDRRFETEMHLPGTGFPVLPYTPGGPPSWDPGGMAGSSQIVTVGGIGLYGGGQPFHWRTRLVTRSPYFPRTPWLSPATDWETGADIRVDPAIVAVGDDPRAARLSLSLAAPYPNPFRAATTLRFTLPQAGPASIWIADVAGRRVRRLAEGARPAGEHAISWDGRDDEGRRVAAGVYFLTLDALGGRRTARAVFLR